MFCGQGIGQLLRAVYFLIVPRALGAEQYGAFVGVTSLAAILAPFASWGAGGLIVKNVSRNKKVFDEYWGNSLLLSVVSGSILIGIMLGVAQFALSDRIPWALIWLVAISDLLFSKILDVGTQAFQAFDLLAATKSLDTAAKVHDCIGRLLADLVLQAVAVEPQDKVKSETK